MTSMHPPDQPRLPLRRPLRNRLASLAYAVAFGAMAAQGAAAQDYPQRSITLINPNAAGGGFDTLKTIIFDRVSSALGVPIVLESRGGASGAIGATHAAKAAPDGYTLLIAGSSVMATNTVAQKALPYDPVRDFTPIALLGETSALLVVQKSLPVTNAREYVDFARARPGKLNNGSFGPGSLNHLAFEMLKHATGIDVVQVPYRGSGPLMIALLAGEIESALEYYVTLRPHLAKGTFRLLGIAARTRFALLPDVPTLAEQGFPIDAGGAVMLVAPAGLPAPIADRLNAEVNKVLALPEVRERLLDLGYGPLGGTREQAASRVAADLAKWSKLARDINFTPQ